nr:hypothetical protein [uncultured Cellulosilyticum sp.]
MGVVEKFLDDLKVTIISTLRELIQEEIQQQTTDKWLDKKQLAEYWGVSVKWIDNHLDEIPHSKTIPWRFKKSLADEWRMGEHRKLEVAQKSNVTVKNYKSNNFKVGN